MSSFIQISVSASVSTPISSCLWHVLLCLLWGQLCFWKVAVWKSSSIWPKLHPKATMHHKSLHLDNRNIEPQVTENTYCWLHNVWQMRRPWSALDLCIKQHSLGQGNHRGNLVLAFGGTALCHREWRQEFSALINLAIPHLGGWMQCPHRPCSVCVYMCVYARAHAHAHMCTCTHTRVRVCIHLYRA